MMQIRQDVRHAVRALGRHPGYLATAVLTLALGIGFTTATFSVINAVLLKPLPFAQPDRLMLVRERKLPQFPEFSVAPGHYLTWREQTRTFDDIAAWGRELANLDTGSADPERVRAARVTAHLFPLLGVTPAPGRRPDGRRRRAGRAGGRADLVWHVAAPVRRTSGRDWPIDAAGRGACNHRRGDGCRVRLPGGADGNLGADGVYRGRAPANGQSLSVGHRTPEARRFGGASAVGHQHRGRSHRAEDPESSAGWDVLV